MDGRNGTGGMDGREVWGDGPEWMYGRMGEMNERMDGRNGMDGRKDERTKGRWNVLDGRTDRMGWMVGRKDGTRRMERSNEADGWTEQDDKPPKEGKGHMEGRIEGTDRQTKRNG